mmetsp:Transcript_21038/g.63239  ORF Transcript_21038/g.63239 Transcript_21038/m.63239 type:complete len:521 (+) Transcript_21038:101-1663(+)
MRRHLYMNGAPTTRVHPVRTQASPRLRPLAGHVHPEEVREPAPVGGQEGGPAVRAQAFARAERHEVAVGEDLALRGHRSPPHDEGPVQAAMVQEMCPCRPAVGRGVQEPQLRVHAAHALGLARAGQEALLRHLAGIAAEAQRVRADVKRPGAQGGGSPVGHVLEVQPAAAREAAHPGGLLPPESGGLLVSGSGRARGGQPPHLLPRLLHRLAGVFNHDQRHRRQHHRHQVGLHQQLRQDGPHDGHAHGVARAEEDVCVAQAVQRLLQDGAVHRKALHGQGLDWHEVPLLDRLQLRGGLAPEVARDGAVGRPPHPEPERVTRSDRADEAVGFDAGRPRVVDVALDVGAGGLPVPDVALSRLRIELLQLPVELALLLGQPRGHLEQRGARLSRPLCGHQPPREGRGVRVLVRLADGPPRLQEALPPPHDVDARPVLRQGEVLGVHAEDLHAEGGDDVAEPRADLVDAPVVVGVGVHHALDVLQHEAPQGVLAGSPRELSEEVDDAPEHVRAAVLSAPSLAHD